MKLLLLLALLALSVPAWADSPLRPDPALTPGDTRSVTLKNLCPHANTKAVRNVTEPERRQVFAEYHISYPPKHGQYEVDHLISLELGGSNDIKNLWPQDYTTKPWNAHVKDKLENKLHSLVCAGKMTLKDAQQGIAADWIALYQKVFRKP